MDRYCRFTFWLAIALVALGLAQLAQGTIFATSTAVRLADLELEVKLLKQQKIKQNEFNAGVLEFLRKEKH